MPPQIEIQAANIVIRGDFNPAIFHPSWFASYELIRQEEADAAKIQIVHPDAAVFSTDWLEFNVMRDRFLASTKLESHYDSIRDLVISILGLLSQTPLKAMGFNREFHCRLQSVEAWHSLGHKLAPKIYWEELLANPGMKSLTIQGTRSDSLAGYIQVKVEPSNIIEHGIFVTVNDHYILHSDKPSSASSEAIEILNEYWNLFLDRSLNIANTICKLEGEE
ncbi:hypothetical protein ACFLW2_04955 [Chloroflexota bacterium]